MNKQEESIQVTNAGPLVRLAALSYDALLVIGLWFVIGIIFVAANDGEHVATHNPFLPSAMFIALFWFNTHFWRRGGQTLGMRAWRLRLVNDNKGPMTLMQCLVRFIVAIGSTQDNEVNAKLASLTIERESLSSQVIITQQRLLLAASQVERMEALAQANNLTVSWMISVYTTTSLAPAR